MRIGFRPPSGAGSRATNPPDLGRELDRRPASRRLPPRSREQDLLPWRGTPPQPDLERLATGRSLPGSGSRSHSTHIPYHTAGPPSPLTWTVLDGKDVFGYAGFQDQNPGLGNQSPGFWQSRLSPAPPDPPPAGFHLATSQNPAYKWPDQGEIIEALVSLGEDVTVDLLGDLGALPPGVEPDISTKGDFALFAVTLPPYTACCLGGAWYAEAISTREALVPLLRSLAARVRFDAGVPELVYFSFQSPPTGLPVPSMPPALSWVWTLMQITSFRCFVERRLYMEALTAIYKCQRRPATRCPEILDLVPRDPRPGAPRSSTWCPRPPWRCRSSWCPAS